MKQKHTYLLSAAAAALVLAGFLTFGFSGSQDGEPPARAGGESPAPIGAATEAERPEGESASGDAAEVAAPAGEAPAPRPAEAAAAEAVQSEIIEHLLEPWTGDLDGMVERGFVRLLTVHNPLYLTYDGVHRKGLAVDLAQAFEEHLTERLGIKRSALQVVVVPVPRDELLPYLVEGKGDLVAANLTITPARQELVDFSDPTYPDVRELVVSGPAAPPIASLDDLVSAELHIRPSSSYYEHLAALNRVRRDTGRAEIPVVAADEVLEDYDLLEMVNAGLIPAIIVDSHKAALWAQVFENIEVHEDLAINEGGSIAWAMRPKTPKLKSAVNDFVAKAKKGTLLGNILIKRYLTNVQWIDNVRSGEAQKRYEASIDIIKTYAGRYDFDWLMIMAQGYQESKLDQSKRSKAGAVGIMQVLPSTAADPNVGIPDIEHAEPNVHAGVKYLRFLRDRYFSSEEISPLDRVLLSFAAYNAGPRNIARAQKKAVQMGLDPNRWFGQLEVAAAKTISREPVLYVRNIYKYYVAYKKTEAIRARRQSLAERPD